MKNKILIFGFFLSLFFCRVYGKDVSFPPPKKKILIFTSNIGAGHKSPTEAVKNALGDKYEIQTVNFIEEIAANWLLIYHNL